LENKYISRMVSHDILHEDSLAYYYCYSGCDVPTHLYSFSFNLNPNWSKELCDQKEILECGALTYSPSYCYFMLNINKDIEATVDKFKLRPYMHFSVECLGAKWVAEKTKWEVRFHDLQTGLKYTREASIFVSAVGGISEPRDVRFSGMEKFKGAMFHTARWDHTYDYTGKRMAVIGNGCSAAQVVPNVVNKVKYIKQ
jgi:cation diffusion facilitator CzcD-associated flavoprotein CzcO